MQAFITQTAAFMPNQPVPNQKIEAVLGQIGRAPSTVKDLILQRNGIKWRYYAIDPATGKPTHTNAELTAEAIRKLAGDAKLSLDDINVLACGTSSPDQFIPNHAVMVHGLLKNVPCEVISTAGVCCSGMTAMKYGYNSVMAGQADNAVVAGSELASASLRASQYEIHAPQDNANPYVGFSQEFLRFMLSDGAGAVLIENAPKRGPMALRIDWIEIRSFANELQPCMYSGGMKNEQGIFHGWRDVEGGVERAIREGAFNLSQDVQQLGENMVPVAGRFFEEVLRKRQFDPREINWFLPHLSSYFFMEPIMQQWEASGLAIPEERWFTNLKYKGNTGSASIFIMLDELMTSGKLKLGHTVLCAVPESARFSFALMHLTAVPGESAATA